MHPILFEIGGLQIPSYGAALVSAFLVALFFTRREAVSHNMDADKVGDTAITGLLFGLLGAKLLLILVDLDKYIADPAALVGTIRSAGVIYGGLIGGAAGIVWYMRRHKLPMLATLDIMAPYAALGVGLGRISCIAAGCCHGFPYEGAFSMVYPEHPLCEAPPGVGLFPIQPLGILNGIVLCLVLRYLLHNRYHFKGQIIVSFMFLYGMSRGLLEFLRGDEVRGIWFGGYISTSQLIGLVAMAAAVVLYRILGKEGRS